VLQAYGIYKVNKVFTSLYDLLSAREDHFVSKVHVMISVCSQH